LQLAARYPELLDGMFLIAAAGLKRKRPLHKKIYMKGRILLFKTLKKLVPEKDREKLYKAFGSSDYNNAGPMRKIFVRVVNEDLSSVAKHVKCPVHLVFGENDSETPAEFGHRYSKLITGSQLTILKDQDHYTVLGEGRHPVAGKLLSFIKEVENDHSGPA
jgi:pimeloyl-ACP methyl ester carboxylesterase